ncbi:recombinase family protein [Actinokineospora sp. PR83]|uniref:recombinase family protein n=1 Tax=Actinokineospora sp. PR83 TaxID=2884908 RepID=UPI0027E1045F|nr:recombinase family protein [Actinokineospora sp. PR83]MCG8914902.1 recombinase family protein [Actinokineospora sp. PR83]
MEAAPPAEVVFGYVRSVSDRPGYVEGCKETLAWWCAREGWELWTVFTDVCSGVLEADERPGFTGLLDALDMRPAAAVVVVDGGHLSHRVEVVASLVRELVLRGIEPWVMDGGLPPEVERVLSGRLPGS